MCVSLIRDCETGTAFAAAAGQNLPAIFRTHPFPESMVPLPLKIGRLSVGHRHSSNPLGGKTLKDLL